MGQLTNLYVSESYQGLLKLNNSTTGVTGTLQYVTDGIGNNIPMQVSTSSIVISGSFYGDGSGLTGVTANIDSGSLVTTSSFNAYTSSNDTKWNNLGNQSGSWITESETGSFATLGSNTFTGTQTIQTNGESLFVSGALQRFRGNAFSVENNSSVTKFQVNTVSNLIIADLPISASQGITGSLFGTSSYATQALSASYAPSSALPSGVVSGSAQITDLGFLQTSSFNSYTSSNDSKVNSLIASTGSYATTSSVTSLSQSIATTDLNQNNRLGSLENKTGSYATTGSNNFVGQQNINGSVNVTGSLNVTDSITALSASITYLKTIYQTSSVIFTSGSNILGDSSNDTQTLYGTVILPNGPLDVTGSIISSGSISSYDYVSAPTIRTTTVENPSLGDLSLKAASNGSVRIFGPGTTSLIVTGSANISGALNVQTALTASGLNYPTADGTNSGQVLQTDAAGTLSFGNVNGMYQTVHNGEATSLTVGTAVYVSGSQGANPIVYRADSANSSKMPVQYIIPETIAANQNGRALLLGVLEGYNVGSATAGTLLWVDGNGTLTSTRPTGSTDITQPVAIVTKTGPGGQLSVLNPGPVLLPNIATGNMWVGNGNNYPISVATSSLAVGTAVSASYATNALSASYAPMSIDTSYFATTGSNNFKGAQYITEGNSLTLGANIYGSGSAYPNVTSYVDQTTDPANVYASFQLVDANTTAGFGIAKSSYTPEYPGQTVNLIVGGGSYGGSDSAMIFKDGIVSVPRPLNVTSSLNVAGQTFMSSSNAFPLYVSGTVRTQRIHFDGNPFNNSPAGNLGAIRIDGNNESLNTTMYDKSEITSGSYLTQTVNTGSNYVRTQLYSKYGGTDALLSLENYSGNALLRSTVNTEISGTFKVLSIADPYASIELSGTTGGGLLQSRGDLYVQSNVFGDSVNMGDVILAASGSHSVRVNAPFFNVSSNVNVTGSLKTNGNAVITGSISSTGDISISNGVYKTQDTAGGGAGPAFIINDNGAQPYPGHLTKVNSSTNPGNIYGYYGIDDAADATNNAGLSLQTFTGKDGSNLVTQLYGGGNGNDATNTILYAYDGIVEIPKNVGITGSLQVTAGITGSLYGSASYAQQSLTSSYAENTNRNGLIITGSLGNTQSLTGSLIISGGATSLIVTGSIQVWSSGGISTPTVGISSQLQTPKIISSAGTPAGTINITGSLLHTGSYTLKGNQTNTGSLVITGSVAITGSVQGNVNNLSVTSNTASLNLDNGNFFVLALTGSQDIRIEPSNIKPGQTINVLLNTTGSGTVSFPTSVKQVSGSSYVPTTAVSKDIITLISFDNSSLYLANVKNLI